MERLGICYEIPGFGTLQITDVVTDYTGTLSCDGVLSEGVKPLLQQLAELIHIHVLTSDTFGTVRAQLEGVPLTLKILEGSGHDEQKEAYVRGIGADRVAAFGNGNNDRMMLRAVREAGGLAVAVDNGEGYAADAFTAANILIHGATSALGLLLNEKRCKATLRF